MQTKTIVLLGAGLALATQSAFSQNPGASQTVENLQQRNQFQPAALETTNAPELYAGETSDLGPQSVLKMNVPRWHLEAAGDEQIYYTDNMFLDGTLRQSADVAVSTIQVALDAPTMKVLGGELAPSIGYEHQWFNYGLFDNDHVVVTQFPKIAQRFVVSLDTFDFNAQTVFGNLTWTRDNWVVQAGFNFQRLMDSSEYNEFYREYTPNWSLQKTIEICRHMSVTAGYQGDYRFTISKQPPFGIGDDLNDRTDHGVFGAINFNVCKYAIIQPFYRFQFTYYTGQSRDDYLNSCGLALYVPINKNVSFRTFFSYTRMDTDGARVQTYQNLEGGLGATLSVAF